MKFRQIRNATALISYGGRNFLIDPMFSPKDYFAPIKNSYNPELRWPKCDLPYTAEEIANSTDVIIVTHYHTDHFDQAAADKLKKGKKVFVQDEEDKEILRKLGFSNIEVLTNEGSSFVLTRLFKINCEHGDKKKAKAVFNRLGMRYEAMGVILQHEEEKTIYIAGDTIWCDNVKNAIDKYKPEYIVVNCADAQLQDCGSVLMGCEDIKRIHEYAPNIKIIASHLDCIPHATVGRKELKQYIKNNKLTDFVIIPDDGQIITNN